MPESDARLPVCWPITMSKIPQNIANDDMFIRHVLPREQGASPFQVCALPIHQGVPLGLMQKWCRPND